MQQVPSHFLTTTIDSREAVDEIIAYHQKTGRPIDKWLEVAYFVLIKDYRIMQYFILKKTTLKNLPKAKPKHIHESTGKRHHLWQMLCKRGIGIDEDDSILDKILSNKDGITTIEFVGGRKAWRIVQSDQQVHSQSWHTVQFNNESIIIKCHTRQSKHFIRVNKKGGKKIKLKRASWKVDSKKRPSIYTVYNTPARIIYTPMGGMNKRR